jgi:hypothetical protein
VELNWSDLSIRRKRQLLSPRVDILYDEAMTGKKVSNEQQVKQLEALTR